LQRPWQGTNYDPVKKDKEMKNKFTLMALAILILGALPKHRAEGEQIYSVVPKAGGYEITVTQCDWPTIAHWCVGDDEDGTPEDPDDPQGHAPSTSPEGDYESAKQLTCYTKPNPFCGSAMCGSGGTCLDTDSDGCLDSCAVPF
jgi:hypothetical protein